MTRNWWVRVTYEWAQKVWGWKDLILGYLTLGPVLSKTSQPSLRHYWKCWNIFSAFTLHSMDQRNGKQHTVHSSWKILFRDNVILAPNFNSEWKFFPIKNREGKFSALCLFSSIALNHVKKQMQEECKWPMLPFTKNKIIFLSETFQSASFTISPSSRSNHCF